MFRDQSQCSDLRTSAHRSHSRIAAHLAEHVLWGCKFHKLSASCKLGPTDGHSSGSLVSQILLLMGFHNISHLPTSTKPTLLLLLWIYIPTGTWPAFQFSGSTNLSSCYLNSNNSNIVLLWSLMLLIGIKFAIGTLPPCSFHQAPPQLLIARFLSKASIYVSLRLNTRILYTQGSR